MPGKLRNEGNADIICERLAEKHTLREIAAELGCTAGAIAIWANEDEEFAKRYARAMDLRTDLMAEELLEISDDGTNDWMERQVGEDQTITVVDHEHIARSRLRVDTRKWLMAKMMPKKYGERMAVTGADGKDLIPESADPGKMALAVLSVLHAAKKPVGGE